MVHTCRATWPLGGGVPAVAAFLRSGGFAPFAVETDENQVPFWTAILEDGMFKHGTLPTYTSEGRHSVQVPLNGVGIWVGKGKPIAHAYVDDRAVEFTGDWPAVLARLLGTAVA